MPPYGRFLRPPHFAGFGRRNGCERSLQTVLQKLRCFHIGSLRFRKSLKMARFPKCLKVSCLHALHRPWPTKYRLIRLRKVLFVAAKGALWPCRSAPGTGPKAAFGRAEGGLSPPDPVFRSRRPVVFGGCIEPPGVSAVLFAPLKRCVFFMNSLYTARVRYGLTCRPFRLPAAALGKKSFVYEAKM